MQDSLFENDKWYRIRSAGDGTVLQVEGMKIICAPEKNGQSGLQSFQLILEGSSGNFRLACKSQKASDPVHVCDYLPHKGLLVHKKATSGEISTQVWHALQVKGMERAFYIVSVADPTQCLKNMNSEETGFPQQAQVVDKITAEIANDAFIYWYFQPDSAD